MITTTWTNLTWCRANISHRQPISISHYIKWRWFSLQCQARSWIIPLVSVGSGTMEIFHESECQWIQQLSGAQISNWDNCSLILSLWLPGHHSPGWIKIIKIKPIIILFWEGLIRNIYSIDNSPHFNFIEVELLEWSCDRRLDCRVSSSNIYWNSTLCINVSLGPIWDREYSVLNSCWGCNSGGSNLRVDGGAKTNLHSAGLPWWYFKVDTLRGRPFRINLLLSSNYIKNNMIMGWLSYVIIIIKL